MSKEILVTGGLGFIGSHTVVELCAKGYVPVIVDNLSNTSVDVLKGIEKITNQKVIYYQLDVNDKQALETVFAKHQIQSVIHFAAFKAVGESVQKPLLYYRNNVGGLISLMEVMHKFNCNQIVFSSSCTVYGQPKQLPVAEDSPVAIPTSPYGNTKKICEEILKDDKSFQVVSLRYFNPIGAHPSAEIGELPLGVPNNLVPYITQTAAGLRQELTIHGKDYDTPDGTCVRDYLHVCDLADAHILAIERLSKPDFGATDGHFEVYNLGTGIGNSVTEVVETFEKSTGQKLNYIYGPRREGDVEQVWANPAKANKILGWKTKRNLAEMLISAWRWQQKLGKGFEL
ncbi:MAG: UDP-glucose 4-epimerase GalE [Bacteroidia bacterium]|nr:UDP-glucose 4-epimerase GalE [Bacteroidia bacterium]MCO5253183.1 UDP-glucose 4-epimerase GalE [Bacteroidota bacterium]MCZ2128794.1 UDP-glucose 4-epimerase GalE [Bacteroidia bacterium]